MTIRAVGLGVAALATAALALGVLAAGAAAIPKELSGVSARRPYDRPLSVIEPE